ncbi:MAG TPA: DUF4412 domain-containing protein [Candidatus Methylacidiphilales bacterium]|nr:DUF4412 domain-containing protein [Candidatus Methylacidiphilales bacterium]
MNLTRLVLLIVAGCSLALNPLRAQSTPPWTPDKQFSAEQVISTRDGMTINSKVYVDTGKIRTDMDGHGMNISSIALLDEKKMYTIMEQQKMVMEMPLSDAKAQQMQAATGGGSAKFDVVGPDSVDGTACTKYKMTTGNDPKVFYWWINTAAHTPVKMAAEDGSFSVVWKNYKTGPQDPSLFQPPSGYQVMQMPAGMGMPGGGAPGGQ